MLFMVVVAPGDQNLAAVVFIEIGHEYFLLDAETGIDHELVKILAGSSTADKNKKTEERNTHGGQYNSRPRGSAASAYSQL